MEKKLHVLILEDLPSDVELAQRELKKTLKNYTVKVVETEEDFIKALNTFKPDLIVADYLLPSFDGLSALKIKKNKSPFIPFVVLTGSMNEDTAVDCMKAGADDYVIKEHIMRLGPAVLNAIKNKRTEWEEKKAEEEIRQKTEDIALINRLNNAINHGDSLFKILQLLARETKRIFSCQGETVYLLSEDKKYLDMKIFTRPPTMISRIEKLIGRKIPAIRISMKSGSLYLKTLQKGQPRLINDPETIRGLMAEFTENKILKKLIPKIYQALDTRSVIDVPFVSKDKAFGLLEISRGEPFTESDLNRIKFISEQLTSIIEHKKVIDDLWKSEEKFRITLKNSPIVVWNQDKGLCYTWIYNPNPGFKPEEIIGRTDKDLLPADDAEKMMHLKRKVLESGIGVREETKTTIQGNDYYYDLTVDPLLDSNNTIIGITCVAIDITSRKKAEQELKVSEENYRTLFENTGTAMLVIEEDMVSSMVNTQCEKLTGYSKEEIENKMKWTDFVLPEDLERMKKYHIERRKAGGKAPTEYEFRLIDKKGNIRDMFLKIGMIPNTKKSVVSMIDITELKKVQEGLRSSREKYFNLFNNANDLIQVANPVGKLLTVNKKWLEILEYSQEEVKGLRVNDIIRKDKLKQISKQMQKTLKGKNIDFETVFISKSGKEINVEGRGNGLFKDGKFVSAMGIFRDITKRRQAEEKLKKTMDAALQTMSKIIEVKDPYTAGHQQRVSQLAAAIAKELDLSQDKVEGIRVASLIHDIGKIGIPSEILSKSTALSDIEFSLIKAHAQIGYDILKSIDFSYPVAQIVLQHHEKMDGSGYPNGLREENILQEAKIICVADVVEAMSSHRPYRPALGIDAALEEISQNKGILYDAEVVNVCLNLFKKKGFKFE